MRVLATHLLNVGQLSNSEREGNMKLAKYLSIAALLLVSLAAQLNAQTLEANVAGSSALWIEAGQGAFANAGTGSGNCSWTSSTSGNTWAQEQRPVGGSPENTENGNIWVIWTPGGGGCEAPDSTVQIWSYLNLDSVFGDRCLFAQPSCTANIGGTVVTYPTTGCTVGANLLTGIDDTSSANLSGCLPASIASAITGQPITIAATDILPVDAEFATYKALAPCGSLNAGTQYVGFGYGPGNVGATIDSTFSSKNYHVINFSIYGTDPITGTAIPPYTITPVGATPIVVAINVTDTAGFGGSGYTNVNRAELGLIYGGIFSRTVDILSQAYSASGGSGFVALTREPLSGTYNTFENGIPNNKEIYKSQESYNCGTAGTYTVLTNPLNWSRTIGSFSGTHKRVIGTTEMIKTLAATADSIGYAFWSAANFSTTNNVSQTNLKYLTVDGVDPIQTNYTTGLIPQSSAQLANVNLSNVANGSYPIWSELRFITTSSAGLAAATTLAGYTQAESTTPGGAQPDFIIAPNLNVFHGHFQPSGFFNFSATNLPSDGPRVCGTGASPEDGGDVGGLVFSIQAGGDYCVLKGNYGAPGSTNNPNGPTNLASFGIHQ
jgi:hypothetical protein